MGLLVCMSCKPLIWRIFPPLWGCGPVPFGTCKNRGPTFDLVATGDARICVLPKPVSIPG